MITKAALQDADNMHELSIAIAIVDQATEEAERRGGVRVNAVHIRVPQPRHPRDGLIGRHRDPAPGRDAQLPRVRECDPLPVLRVGRGGAG